MSISETIIFGAISSLIATIIWVVVINLYEFSASKKITFLLQECDSSTRLLLNSIRYIHYSVALTQVEKLMSLYLQIYSYLKPINFSSKKRKLIKSIMFNMIRVLNIFKNLDVGYEGDRELEARCKSYNIKYLYEIKTGENSEESFLLISISFLQELTNRFGINKAILRSLQYFDRTNVFHKNILDSLIEVNSFSEGFSLNYFMNKEGLTENEYEKLTKKILKIKATKNSKRIFTTAKRRKHEN
ncbi:MAG: hypothetical protein GX926_00975 [Candidatus Magasanikbacteria bacterium]|jgi:hypothetical protein|nr:hypothetical protein [Candidatus Magasanikbacteria bacterium]